MPLPSVLPSLLPEGGGAVGNYWFDGITLPKLSVHILVSGALWRPANAFVLDGTSLLDGTKYLGAGSWVNIIDDVEALTIDRGRDSDTDSAIPGSLVVRVDNTNGDYNPENLSGLYVSGGATQIDVGLPICVQAEWLGVVYDLFYGEVADVELDLDYENSVVFTCADGLERLGTTRLGPSIFQVDGEYTGQRIGRVLDAAGWATSLRALDRGYSQLGLTDSADYALALLQKIERTEFGLVFVDGAGRVVFYDRYRPAFATRSTTVQALFDSSVELTGLSASRSRERMANDWHITRTSIIEGDEPVEQSAFDQASVDKYGIVSGPSGFGELSRNDEEARAMCQGLVQRFKASLTRVRSVSLEAAALDMWSTLLGLELLDRIKVDVNNGPNSLSKELLIQKLHQEITVNGRDEMPTWDFTFTTSQALAAPSLFKLDGTKLLNSTNTLGW